MKLQDLLEGPAFSMQRFIQTLTNSTAAQLLRNIDTYKDGTLLVRAAYLREVIGRDLIGDHHKVEKLKEAGYLDDDVVIACIETSNPHLFLELTELEHKTKINFLSDKAKLAAVKENAMSLALITNPTPEMVKIGLTDEEFINDYPEEYERTVRNIFKNNTILMNKWLRYAENMRNMS